MRLEKIVSGGQTGADRAALDVAMALELQIGGWLPKGRLAEDGRIPEPYSGLIETESSDPASRTRLNVRDSDATLVISHGPLLGGSLLTLEEAQRRRKPVVHLDLQTLDPTSVATQLREWLTTFDPRVLNVAGPRASEDPNIYAAVVALLQSVLDPGGAHGSSGDVKRGSREEQTTRTRPIR